MAKQTIYAERIYTKPDPETVFKAIAELLSEQEGVRITIKSFKRKDEKQKQLPKGLEPSAYALRI